MRTLTRAIALCGALGLYACGQRDPGSRFATLDECVTDTWVRDYVGCPLCDSPPDHTAECDGVTITAMGWDSGSRSGGVTDCVTATYFAFAPDHRMLWTVMTRSASLRSLSAFMVTDRYRWEIDGSHLVFVPTVGSFGERHRLYCDDTTLVMDAITYGRAGDAVEAALLGAWETRAGVTTPSAWASIHY